MTYKEERPCIKDNHEWRRPAGHPQISWLEEIDAFCEEVIRMGSVLAWRLARRNPESGAGGWVRRRAPCRIPPSFLVLSCSLAFSFFHLPYFLIFYVFVFLVALFPYSFIFLVLFLLLLIYSSSLTSSLFILPHPVILLVFIIHFFSTPLYMPLSLSVSVTKQLQCPHRLVNHKKYKKK